MQRFEFKYVIQLKDLLYAESQLQTISRPGKQYDVTSIYFDDAKLSAFYAKLDGLYERHKIRIRAYSKVIKDVPLYLEQKKRQGSFISKKRHEISESDFDNALKGKSSEPWLKGLHPTLTVYYHRKEFLFSWGRVTIDTDITFNHDRFSWRYKNAILEIKTENPLKEEWLNWLNKISQVQAFSKYAEGMKLKLGENKID